MNNSVPFHIGYDSDFKYTVYSISNFYHKINSFFAYKLSLRDAFYLSFSGETAQKAVFIYIFFHIYAYLHLWAGL